MLSLPETGMMFIGVIIWLLAIGLGIYVIILFRKFVIAVEKIADALSKK